MNDFLIKEKILPADYRKAVQEAIESLGPNSSQKRISGSVHEELEVYESSSELFSWLHLTDLHIGCKERNQDWESLKKALLEDLQSHRKPADNQAGYLAGVTYQPNAIFITGDIAYKASAEEYKEAENFLKAIWEITGLGKEQTFIVPGNHDVNRVVVEKHFGYKKMYNSLSIQKLSEEMWFTELAQCWEDPTFLPLVKAKSANYLHFIETCTSLPTDELYYVRPALSSIGTKVDIVGLNSTFMSWKDDQDQEQGLWIGKYQLDELERRYSHDAVFRIALVHHPSEVLHIRDEVTWARIRQACPLILHGHLHRSRVISGGEPGQEHLCLPGGSVHEGGKWQSQHYSYGQLDLQTRQVDIYMRMTKPGAFPVYIQDNITYYKDAPHGRLQRILPKRS